MLAGLSRAGKAAQCLTIATSDPSGDERVYARMVAEHFGFPLHERFYDVAHVDPDRCAAPHLPHPKRRPLYQSMGHLANEVAAATGADAFFSGNGGDHVFCFLQSATPILDCLRARRPLLEILAAYENIALLTGCSLGEALGGLWRRSRRPVRYSWPLTDDLLHPEQIGDDASHPWFDCPKDALPGKAFHIAMLAKMQEDMEVPFPLDGPPMITPLMAQPVMEICLAIPSWKWISGGRNRSIARDGFQHRMPKKIAERRGKPGPARFSFEILKAVEGRLKEMLLDGMLAERGIIDREKVEVACGAIATLDGTQGRRLLQLTDAEAWCRHWSGRKMPYHEE
ncbi:asparagine synthase-related protein [Sphingobium yanoikuyae]|uniref:asparagine synthase-related protein n=1 Tax=Sphingobium yanoikuyae TaxID=13690 RepID=UPI0035C84E58